MKGRFDNKISRMKEQKLSFANDGVEVTLSVPDTNEVKDVFSYTASTLASQQQQVLALQATIAHMAEDNARAQSNIIAWATKCMEDLQEQNKQLQERLKETELQLTRKVKNLEYNTQGYVDAADLPPKTVSAEASAMIFNLGSNEPPKILKTSVPTVSPDPDLSIDESSLVYNNKRDEEFRNSPETFHPPIDMAAQNELTMEKAEAIIKRKAKLEEAKKYYHSIGAPKKPTSASHRWKWAFKKVLKIIRMKSSKIGMTRSRVVPGHSVADRLERIEHAIYEIPVTLRAHIHQKTTELKKQVDEQFKVVEATMAEDRKTTKELCSALDGRIDAVNVRVDQVAENLKNTDDRLTALDEFVQEYIKNQEAILDEKINAVHDRITTIEMVQIDAIRQRIRDLLDRTTQLKGAAAAISTTLVIDPELDCNGNDMGSKELFNLMKMDTNLWKSRAAISTVEGNVFTISELLHSLTRDITTAFCNEQSRIPPELKDDILNECKGMDESLVIIGEDMNGVTNLWKEHEQNIAKRWENVAQLADMAKTMKNLTSELTAMTQGLEVVKTSVSDLSSNLDNTNTRLDNTNTQVKTNTNDVEIAQGHIKVIKEEINTLQKVNPQEIVDKALNIFNDNIQSNKIDPIEEKINDLSIDLKNLKDNQYTGPTGPIGTTGPSEVIREIKAPDNLEQMINSIIQSYLPGLTPVVQTAEPSSAPPPRPKGEILVDRTAFEIENHNQDEEEPEIVNLAAKIRMIDDEHYGRSGIVIKNPQSPDLSDNQYVIQLTREEPKPTIDLEQIEKLQSQIVSISKDVELICNDLSSKADVTLLEDKASYDVVSLVEKSVEDVIFDLGNTKAMTDEKLKQLRQELLEALMRAIKKALEDRENERLTLLATKSLCMGCGRSSSVAANVLPGAMGTKFQSALNAHSTNGPDVYRGGFKMPVRAKSPTIGMSNRNAYDPKEITALFNNDPNQEDITDSPEYLSRDERNLLESSSWIDNQSNSDYDSPVKQVALAVKAVRHAQGREESAMLRPIHRKGFPGSKSLRAQTAYGPLPARFEPPVDLSRHMNELLSAHSSVLSVPIIKNNKKQNLDDVGIRFTQSGFI